MLCEEGAQASSTTNYQVLYYFSTPFASMLVVLPNLIGPYPPVREHSAQQVLQGGFVLGHASFEHHRL